jgi:sugar phosphate isomerase/epimerase
MRMIMFSKMLKGKSVPELAELAKQWGLDGFDLCVRPEYPVTPDNAGDKLPEAVAFFRQQGLDIPMVTGNFDLLGPDHPTAAPLLRAMDRADVRLLKLGYFRFDPATMDYQEELAKTRATLRAWAPLAKQYGVKICYHTHSNKCMGLNAAALAHLFADLDPALFGAYLDPGHLRVEGEDFAVALAMVKPWLSIIAVKDVFIEREESNGHGKGVNRWVTAGKGMVDWTYVFACLKKINFQGPVSVHCEFKAEPDQFLELARKEIAFFRNFV